jgi:hypothetical protein
MIYLKSILAGIAGSILGILLFVVTIILLNVTGAAGSGMTGIGIVFPLGLVVLGFAGGYFLMFRRLRRRILLN